MHNQSTGQPELPPFRHRIKTPLPMPLKGGCWLILLCFVADINAQQGIAYHPNPHTHWFFLSPSAYSPPPKKAIYQNGLLAAWQYQKTTPRGNSFTFGLIPTLLLGESYMPVWVSGHRRIPIGGSSDHPFTIANIGGFFLSIPKQEEQNESRDFSMFYLNFSFGNREKNFALGGAIVPTGLGQGRYPQAITLHGMTRLGRRSCLVTENYLLHDSGRWMPCSMSGWRGWGKRTAFDIAVMVTRIPAGLRANNKALWLPIPWLAVHRTLSYDFLNRGDD